MQASLLGENVIMVQNFQTRLNCYTFLLNYRIQGHSFPITEYQKLLMFCVSFYMGFSLILMSWVLHVNNLLWQDCPFPLSLHENLFKPRI